MPRKIRASKDEETQPPLTQRPEFIIGMTFLAVVAAFIISVLIFRFIQRRKRFLPRGDAQRGDQGGDDGIGVGFATEKSQILQTQSKNPKEQQCWENKILNAIREI